MKLDGSGGILGRIWMLLLLLLVDVLVWRDLVDLRVERDLDVCLGLGSVVGVDDDDMDLLEVLKECVEVGEMETTTCVIPTKFSLPIKDIECVEDGATLAIH